MHVPGLRHSVLVMECRMDLYTGVLSFDDPIIRKALWLNTSSKEPECRMAFLEAVSAVSCARCVPQSAQDSIGHCRPTATDSVNPLLTQCMPRATTLRGRDVARSRLRVEGLVCEQAHHAASRKVLCENHRQSRDVVTYRRAPRARPHGNGTGKLGRQRRDEI